MGAKYSIPYMQVQTTDEEIEAVARVLRSNRHCDGPEIRAFEIELARYLGTAAVVAVNSGSTANLLALRQMRRDHPELKHAIISACSFATTFNAVLEVGYRPVVIDVEPEMLMPTRETVRSALERFPDSVLVITHLMGVAWPYVNDAWGVPILEDCCDALGALVGERKVGTLGTFGTFSFYPAHHINCAGGGAISVSRPNLDVELRHTREWGRMFVQGAPVPPELHEFEARYTYIRRGGNFQLNELQAALGLAQLKRLDEFVRKRNRNHDAIAARLKEEGLLDDVTFVKPMPGTTPSWFGFPAILERNLRPRLIRFLGERGIQCRPVIGGNVLRQPAYRDVPHEKVGDLAGCDKIHERGFFVASHPYLTDDEIEYIVTNLREFLRS